MRSAGACECDLDPGTPEEIALKTRVIQDEPETDDHSINGRAPVVGVSETEISAAPEVVWDVLSGIEAWPTWNPEVRAVSMHGDSPKDRTFAGRLGPERSPRRSSA